ncbi:MAG: nodulation protein NfeD [Deltaproteobacteria bacterium]|nr:nodulation protein NfeD [Deltaproteobacteria bacterium]
MPTSFYAWLLPILIWGQCVLADRPKEVSPAPKDASATLTINKILGLTIDSSINPGTYNYLMSGFEKAKLEGYQAILIRLDTPGGLVSTTKDILTLIGDSNILTIVWITPEGASASSAGAIIASGAHVLAMSPGTNFGAATPIQMSQDIEQGDMRKKAINDLVALVQSLSESRGRNAELFGKMIEEAASYKSKEALENNLIDYLVSTEQELLEKMNDRKVTILGQEYKLATHSATISVSHEMDLGQQLLNTLASPGLAYVLFLLGAALLYLEFQAPGGFIAGSIGALCLLLAGIGFQVLPLNFGALGLIVLSFIMFILEAYITSYGLLSIAGLAALLAGSLFLFRTDEAYMSVSRSLVFSSVGVVALFLAGLGIYFLRDLRRHKLPKNYYSLIGKKGTIVTILPTEDGQHFYQMRIAGEIWKARSEQEYHVGDHCTVKEEQNGMTLFI